MANIMADGGVYAPPSAPKPIPRWLPTLAFGRCETTPGMQPARYRSSRTNEMKIAGFAANT
jgi:hypothetical protein